MGTQRLITLFCLLHLTFPKKHFLKANKFISDNMITSMRGIETTSCEPTKPGGVTDLRRWRLGWGEESGS